ncbi:hypothetical protein [Streptomyces sp. Y1]|uniref:Asparagine synthase n=1 Tax=Streptomyces sp. Y1 TaxID=3238634 RepID=A0AB39TC00_9ACTN
MFRLRIAATHAPGPWQWDGTRWRCATSWIEPLRHPLTTWSCAADGTRTSFTNTARTSGSSTAPGPGPGAVDDCQDWVRVELDPAGGGRVRVRVSTGTAGTAPLYLAAGRDALHASWDLLELRHHATGLNVLEAARRLAPAVRYTDATLWAGVHLLTERALATYEFGRLSVRLPEPAEPTEPAAQEETDPVETFGHLLDEAVRQVPWRTGATAVLLPGDLASANTALSLATDERGHHLTTAALVLDGERGTQQLRRRAALLEHLGRGWADVQVAAAEHLPYAPGSLLDQGTAVSPYEDLYLDAADTLHAVLQERGTQALFTGVGGTEPTAPRGGAAPPAAPGWLGPVAREALREVDTGLAPASVVSARALMVKAGMAAPLLRRGLWPIHPLTDTALAGWCASLPAPWRANRRLLRERIQRRAMAPEVAQPPLTEHFGTIMDSAVHHHGARHIRRLLHEGSPLLEAGLLDAVALREVAERLETGNLQRGDRSVLFTLTTNSALTAH